MNRELQKKSCRGFARTQVARGARLTLAAVSCTVASLFALGCEDTTLWIGSADAGLPQPPPAVASPPPPAAGAPSTAGSTATPASDAGVIVSGGAGTTSPKHATPVIPMEEDDAGTPVVDAGPLGTPTMQGPPPILRPTDLPVARTPCPSFNRSGTYRFGDPAGRNLNVQLFVPPNVSAKKVPTGALILYWHAVGDAADEVMRGFGKPAIDAVVADGGVVASFNAKLCVECGIAEDAAWYADDDTVSDHVVACALQEAHIDSRRIHAIGFSAGALHSLHLALARSNYIASVVSYSGGMVMESPTADPNNKVPALLAYGPANRDNIIIGNFEDLSLAWYETTRVRGYYSMMCSHDLYHDIPTDLVPHALQFFMDHPYRVSPEPYLQAIPASFPAYCSNMPRRP